VDTNVIIEAVRTGCWRAVTGSLRVETVEMCREEASAGDETRRGYIVVTDDELSRIAAVHSVSERERAAFALDYSDASGMDAGERDLFAHAHSRPSHDWMLCSPDKASIRAAVVLGWSDRLRSLGALAQQIGARPTTALKAHFEESWLSKWRTQFLLEGGIT